MKLFERTVTKVLKSKELAKEFKTYVHSMRFDICPFDTTRSASSANSFFSRNVLGSLRQVLAGQLIETIFKQVESRI